MSYSIYKKTNRILPDSFTQYLRKLKQEQEIRKKELGQYYNREYDGFVCVDQLGHH